MAALNKEPRFRSMEYESRKAYPSNTIIHHQIGRGPYAPSITPFAVKLETYLRMAKVPYLNENDSVTNRSSKGKLTWIEYNGQEVADSEFCIQTVALQRWVYDPKHGIDVRKFLNIPWPMFYMVGNLVKKQSYAQGVGRHSEEEVLQVMDEDLMALSKFLGMKKFMLGEQASQTDCAVFGMLSQIHWHSFGGTGETLYKKYPNLSAYCERMKAKFWPDWNECITEGWTRTASK
uniref:Failed axon connections-like protein n=1 Tax=Magallana gigas TaxID=29159 RepID=K1Q9B8_MAGGI